MTDNALIGFEGVTKRFKELTAVDALSFEARRGEVLGFLGPNGAGKSTSVNMMAGLLSPDEGTIVIEGAPIENGRDPRLRCIGLSPQEIVIWMELTCLEQLTFMGVAYNQSPKHATQRAESLLDDLGLLEKRHRRAKTLSGGMQRRLNIALALVHDPKVLILDEPQAGLDPQSRVLVRDYILKIKGKTTVILTTHDMEEAEKLSDRVCIIDHGKRLVLDTVSNVKSSAAPDARCYLQVASMTASQLETRLKQSLPNPPTLSVEKENLVFEVGASGGPLFDVMAALQAQSLHPSHLVVRETTLEDVFIGMTGRGLRE